MKYAVIFLQIRIRTYLDECAATENCKNITVKNPLSQVCVICSEVQCLIFLPPGESFLS